MISENARLKEENMRLKSEIRKLKRKPQEQPFGLSTPSSKQLFKPSAPETTSDEAKRRMGGAKERHKGHGRECFDPELCEVEELPPLDACPCCGEKLTGLESGFDETRDVLDCDVQPVRRRRFKQRVRLCPHCGKPVRARIPGVLPKYFLSNALIVGAAVDHFLHGVTIGTVSRKYGVNKGTLINAFEHIAEILKTATPKMEDVYRASLVMHADETGWRTDGRNGYAWCFKAGNIVIFKCEETRGSRIPKDLFKLENSKPEERKGVLVTDRYAGYNFYPNHQFCFEHLKRDVLKIVDENPGSKECKSFADSLVPLLREAMRLRNACEGDDVTYLVEASRIRHGIEGIVNRKYRHPSVLNIQAIFQNNEDHLWQWTVDPRIPAENNTAERGVRPLVVARKISHGSQSVKGRETRSVLMSIIHTLANSCGNVAEKLKNALDAYALNPETKMFEAVFGETSLCVSHK